ncbi:hypothetical protein HMPREF9997_00969 [Corynebacterium durum F0235]|uniref:Uncharacterized protein n=1 Tax=Corynebacterium durum F0235 TaxID=1035195 RepID=L1MIP2_9CORY|nr:hypothetical protein HMPREF9997_00969 [Corynebacterium durum F0235]
MFSSLTVCKLYIAGTRGRGCVECAYLQAGKTPIFLLNHKQILHNH